MIGASTDSQHCHAAQSKPVEHPREPARRSVRIYRDQVTPGVRREFHRRVKMFRRADRRNDDRIDQWLSGRPLARRYLYGANRNIRKLKQIFVRLYLERSRKFSVAFRITQVRTSFHLSETPIVRQYPPTTRTGGHHRSTDWEAGPNRSGPGRA